MTNIDAWLEDQVRSLSPDNGPQPLGNLSAARQLVRAWRGLSGQQEGYAFGMTKSSWSGADVDRIKGLIVRALESWVQILDVDDAVDLATRLCTAGISLPLPDAVLDKLRKEAAAARRPPAYPD